MGYKFKIDPVAVAAYAVADDLHAVAFPAMDTVATLLLFDAKGRKLIIPDDAVDAVLRIDAEECILEDIILHHHVAPVVYLDAREVFNAGYAGMNDPESIDQHAIGFYRNDFVFMIAIQRWSARADQVNGSLYLQVTLVVVPGAHQHRIAVGGDFQGGLDRLAGLVLPHPDCFSKRAEKEEKK